MLSQPFSLFRFLLIPILLVSGGFSSVFGQGTTTTGDNTNGQPWARPFANFSGLSSLGPVNWVSHPLFVDTAGNYHFSTVAAGGWDNYAFLYLNSFDPADPLVNGLMGDDDGNGGIGTTDFDFILDPSLDYIVVITGFENGEVGAYTLTVAGPGVATFGQRSKNRNDILSALSSGLPIANAQGLMLLNAGQTATNDVNNHLFNLIAGDGDEAANEGLATALYDGVIMGEGDGPEEPIALKVERSRQWELFTTVNYGNVNLSAIGGQAGVQVDAWAPGVGVQRHLSRGLALGFSASFVTSEQTYTGGLGSLDLEGPALSGYLTFVRKNYWNSLLYSFGTYDMGSERNPGFGFPTAFGSTRAYTHSVQYNTGWNFRFQNNTLVTGPFAGIDYLHGSVDAYNETGGGAAALRYNRQSFESLVTRVGWSVSKKLKTSWASITPQVRLSYERQNLKNNGTSVELLNAPFSANGGNQSPGQDYLVLGAGVNFAFNDQWNLMLGYSAQFFRQDQQSHFGSLRVGYRF